MNISCKQQDRNGRHLPACSLFVFMAFFAVVLLPGSLQARDILTRLGENQPAALVSPENPAPQPGMSGIIGVEMDEATPEDVVILPFAGPIAADGEGRLLLLLDTGDGYVVLRRMPIDGDGFNLVFRRKAAMATSIAVGPDGTFCIGLTSGIDCVDPEGGVAHLEHPALQQITSLAFTPAGDLWIMLSEGPDLTGLRLLIATPNFSEVKSVLTLRDTIQGFGGNGLAATQDGGVLVPVIENDVPRILHVQPNGQFSRVGDFWNLGGGIAVDAENRFYVNGVKRPQSLQEQQNPVDVVFSQSIGGAASFAARFPLAPGGSRLSNAFALGGDGTLYTLRHQRVLVDEGPAVERPILWRIGLQRPSVLGSAGRVIDFGIPFVDSVDDPRADTSLYAGPVLIGKGQYVVVNGLNFEGKQGNRRLLIGGVPADIVTWSDEEIVATIPHQAPGGEGEVVVAIDHVVSNVTTIEVKTPDIPGWFQIGSPSIAATLTPEYAIRGYSGRVIIRGTTDKGAPVQMDETMEIPGLFTVRLPNGVYTAMFSAEYVISDGLNIFIPKDVPIQSHTFIITDDEPIALWLPQMLATE